MLSPIPTGTVEATANPSAASSSNRGGYNVGTPRRRQTHPQAGAEVVDTIKVPRPQLLRGRWCGELRETGSGRVGDGKAKLKCDADEAITLG